MEVSYVHLQLYQQRELKRVFYLSTATAKKKKFPPSLLDFFPPPAGQETTFFFRMALL